MKYIKWVSALLLALFFFLMGIQKFGSGNLVFMIIAERSGIGLFEPTVRMLIGSAEVITAILLVLPITRFIGALMGLGILFGAIGFHLSPWLGVYVPMEPGGSPSLMLYTMAILFTGLNLAVISFERNHARAFITRYIASHARA